MNYIEDVDNDINASNSIPDKTKERHIQIWSKFFENAVNSKTVDQSKSLESSEKWPDLMTDQDYSDSLQTVLQLTNDSLNDGTHDSNYAVEDALSTAIFASVLRMDIAVTEELLVVCGARINCVDDQNRSPIHYACRNGHVAMLALLLDHDAEMEATDTYGRSPLHICAMYNQVDALRFILECGVDCNIVDKIEGNTALHLAAQAGSIECCECLLSFDANRVIKNKLNYTAIDIAQYMIEKKEKEIKKHKKRGIVLKESNDDFILQWRYVVHLLNNTSDGIYVDADVTTHNNSMHVDNGLDEYYRDDESSSLEVIHGHQTNSSSSSIPMSRRERESPSGLKKKKNSKVIKFHDKMDHHVGKERDYATEWMTEAKYHRQVERNRQMAYTPTYDEVSSTYDHEPLLYPQPTTDTMGRENMDDYNEPSLHHLTSHPVVTPTQLHSIASSQPKDEGNEGEETGEGEDVGQVGDEDVVEDSDESDGDHPSGDEFSYSDFIASICWNAIAELIEFMMGFFYTRIGNSQKELMNEVDLPSRRWKDQPIHDETESDQDRVVPRELLEELTSVGDILTPPSTEETISSEHKKSRSSVYIAHEIHRMNPSSSLKSDAASNAPPVDTSHSYKMKQNVTNEEPWDVSKDRMLWEMKSFHLYPILKSIYNLLATSSRWKDVSMFTGWNAEAMSASSDDKENSQEKWTTSAPPTDEELLRKGLGFTRTVLEPPALVASELDSQMMALRNGLTPRRDFSSSSSTPNEVQVAVAMAHAGSGGGGGGYYSYNPSSPVRSFGSPPNTSNASDHHGLNTFQNGYSMGNKLPVGVKWRYVDILQDKNFSDG